MGFDNGSADRKPHTEAISFARVKWLKNFVQIVAAQTSSAISHSYLDQLLAVSSRLQFDLPLARRTFLHGVKRIQHDIEHDLLQLHSIAPYQRQVVFQFEARFEHFGESRRCAPGP